MDSKPKEVWVIEVGNKDGKVITEITSRYFLGTTGAGPFVLIGDTESHSVQYYEQQLVHSSKEEAEKKAASLTR